MSRGSWTGPTPTWTSRRERHGRAPRRCPVAGRGRARRGVPAPISRRPSVTILFPPPPLRRRGAMMAGHATGQPMGGHALAGKWPRRPMGAFLALAPNCVLSSCFEQISHRNLSMNRTGIGRALATAPESAGIGDMQGKATPGLGPWAGASPLPGRMLPLPRRRPRRMRRTKSSGQGRSRIGSMRKSRLRMRWRRPCGQRTTIGGILALSRNTSMLKVWMWAPPLWRSTPIWPTSSTSTRNSTR